MITRYELRYKKAFFFISSVVTQEVHKYQVGETITMSLMRREKGTTYALPKAFWEKREGKIHDYNGKLSCLFRIYLSVKTNFKRKKLKIRIICQCGATCLPVDCCFNELSP